MFPKRKRNEILWWQQLPQWMFQHYHHENHHHHHHYHFHRRHNYHPTLLPPLLWTRQPLEMRFFISKLAETNFFIQYKRYSNFHRTTKSYVTTGFRRNSTKNILHDHGNCNEIKNVYISGIPPPPPPWQASSFVRDDNDESQNSVYVHSQNHPVTSTRAMVSNPQPSISSLLSQQQQYQQLLTMTVQFLQHGIATEKNSTTSTGSNDQNYKQNIAMMQNLLERWIQYYYSNGAIKNTQRSDQYSSNDITLRFITILFQKWFHCFCNMQQQHHHQQVKNYISSPELMHYLYRILYMMQQESKQHYHNTKSHKIHHWKKSNSDHSNKCIQKSYQLLQTFYNYSIDQNQPLFHPKPKAYSMVLEALSYYNLHDFHAEEGATTDPDRRNDTKNNEHRDSWNTTMIIDIADELMQQLDELCKKEQMNRKNDTNHRYHQRRDNILPDDILITQNSYLRLLARYCRKHEHSTRCDVARAISEQHPTILNLAEKAENYLWNHMTLQPPQSLFTLQPPPNVKSYSAVLQAYVNQNAPEQACKVLNRMMDQSIIPDQICYNICLQALGNAGQAAQAYSLLLQMIQLSKRNVSSSSNDTFLLQPPDVYSYLAVIKAYANCCDVTNVIHVFEQMIQNDIFPNTVVYNTVLDVLAHQPNSGPLVEQMLQYLERLHYGSDISSHNHGPEIASSVYVKPCREAYTIAVRAWGKTTNNINAPDHATNIFGRMQRLSFLQHEEEEEGQASDIGKNDCLSPCTISYTSLIHAWAQSYRKDAPTRALQILRFMEQQQESGAIPDTITYNVVLSALARHGLATEAHQLLNEMIGRMMRNVKDNEQRTLYPNCISWATVIQAYTKSKCPDAGMKANDLVLELEHLYDTTGIISLQPTADIYAVVILAQLWGDHINVAEETFWRMIDRYQQTSQSKNTPPNTSVCNALLRLWSNSSDPVAPQRAEMILHWMEDHTAAAQRDDGVNSLDLSPNYDSYHYILQTWYRSKRRNAHIHIQNIERKIQQLKASQHLK